MANRYFVGGGTGNWNSTTNWSDTDGGASGFSFPVVADAVFLTAASGANNITTNVAAACASINCTGFTGNITMTSTLSVSGNVTLDAGMTVSGGAGLSVPGAGTITSNGFQWPNSININGAGTYVVVGAWTCTNFQIGNGGTGTTNLNGAQTISISGSLTIAVTSGVIAGTTSFIMVGTGNLAYTNTLGSLRNNVTINTTGTITLPAVLWRYNTGIFTHIAGTVVVPTGNTLAMTGNTTLDCAGISWKTLTFDFTSGATYTLLSDLTTVTLQLGSSGNPTFSAAINGARNIYVTGNVNSPCTTGGVNGSCTIHFVGGNQSFTKTAGAGVVVMPMVVNSTGTVTFIGSDFRFALTSMQCIAGNVVTPEGAWTILGGGGSAQTSYAEIV